MSIITYQKGFDIATPEPGKYVSMCCTACGSKMLVDRDVEEYTSFSARLAGTPSKVDRFTCPNSGKPWHTHLIKLHQEKDKTVAKAIRDLVESEIELVMLEHRKEVV